MNYPFITLVDQILVAKQKDPNANKKSKEKGSKEKGSLLLLYFFYSMTPNFLNFKDLAC